MDIESAPHVAEASENRPADVSPARPRRFGAVKALLTFLGVIVVQLLVGFGFGIAATLFAVARGANLGHPEEVKRLTTQITVPLLLISPFIALFATLFFTRIWAWDLARDPSPSGLGLVAVSKRRLVVSAAIGMATALAYLAFARFVTPPRPGTQLGPAAAAAASGLFARAVWTFLAICLAPPIEEFLFRGLLLKGFVTSWGTAGGAISVTFLFVISHLAETFHYLPALLGISALAIGAVICRIKTVSILPAIALHCGYNLVLVAALPYL